jgi:YVTN family beta-propeller protein
MRFHRTAFAVSLAALGAILSLPSARAAHAYATVCCSLPSSVSVIDRASHTVTGTLIAGQGAAFASVTPDGATLYVSNETDYTISVFDTATGSAAGLISLAAGRQTPCGTVVSPDGSRLYVEAISGGKIKLVGINTATNAILFNVPIPGVSRGVSFHGPPPSISPDGRTV